jgi:hypothetical protein
MQILVPWKPVVLVWGLVSGLVLVGFLGSSLLEGRNPFRVIRNQYAARRCETCCRARGSAT